VRDLAQAVRIETASLYYHFPSKQEILLDLFDRTMDALVDGLERAAATGSSPEEWLRAAVRFHVLFHVERQDEAFISHSELRSLTAENRKRTSPSVTATSARCANCSTTASARGTSISPISSSRALPS
jgi:AcrR family transcriptional regulator